MIYHNHHIIPKHMGGNDDASNIVRLSIEEHAEAHHQLWLIHGKLQDKVAWLMLSGKTEEGEMAAKQLQKEACRTPEFREKLRQANTGIKKPWVALRNKSNPKPATGTSRAAMYRHKSKAAQELAHV